MNNENKTNINWSKGIFGNSAIIPYKSMTL